MTSTPGQPDSATESYIPTKGTKRSTTILTQTIQRLNGPEGAPPPTP